MGTSRNIQRMALGQNPTAGVWLLIILLAVGGLFLAAQAPGQGEPQNYIFLR